MSLAQTAADGLDELLARFAAHGQGHVFGFWAALDPAGRRTLIRQAAALDLGALERAYREARTLPEALPDDLSPPPVERLPEHGGDAVRQRHARERGEALLADGRAAALVVAGGQGTRLGHAGPKGTLPIGPVSQRSLFGLQAQRLRGLARRYGRPVPWYVMTSAATDAATRAFFSREGWFGLDPDDVFFLVQRQVPCLDFEGRLLLEAPDRIAESPDGHGGVLGALADAGALGDLEARGVEVVSYYQVDNPLVRIADPLLIGLHADAGAEMTCKVVAKRAPDERVGTLARAGSRLRIVEYTEIREPSRSARDARGELVFWAGAIGVHAFSTGFLRRMAGVPLPFHASPKPIPAVDAAGRRRTPGEPNGFKLERFVFDVLPRAGRAMALEVRREDEYAPVKNAEGGESPASARRALSERARRWLAAAGIAEPPSDRLVEVDPTWIDGCDDLRALGIRSVEEAGSRIRTALRRGME